MRSQPNETEQKQEPRSLVDVSIDEFEDRLREIVRDEVWKIIDNLQVQERI